jgi:hypothetical protein
MLQHIEQRDCIDSADFVNNRLVFKICIDQAKLGIFLCAGDNSWGHVRIDQYGALYRIPAQRTIHLSAFHCPNGAKIRQRLDGER